MQRFESEPRIRDHIERCHFHRPISSLACSARQGSHLVCGRTVDVRYYDHGWMPRCFAHRFYYARASYCVVIQECGFPCGEPIDWEPQMLQLCARHIQEAPCYFLSLPVEIRVQIYHYLLPDQVIPARFNTPLRSDGHRVSTAILRTCRQVSSEALPILYSMPFGIAVTTESVTVCNVTKTRWKPGMAHSGYGYSMERNGHQTLQALLQWLHDTEPDSSLMWDDFPVSNEIWRWMKAFQVVIAMPDDNYLPIGGQERNSALPIALCSDTVRLVADHMRQLDQITELRVDLQLGRWAKANTVDIVIALLRRLRPVKHARRVTISVSVDNTTISLGPALHDLCQQWGHPEDVLTRFSSVGTQAHVLPMIFMKIKALIRILDHPLVATFLQCEEHAMVRQVYFTAIEAHETNDIESFHSLYTRVKKLYLLYMERQAEAQKRMAEGINRVHQLMKYMD